MKNVLRPTLTLVVLAALARGDDWAANGAFQNGLAGWELVRRDDDATVELSQVADPEPAAHLHVDPALPTVAAVRTTVELPADRPLLCRVEATCRTTDVAGRVRLVAIFRGGTSAGNGDWQWAEGTPGTTPWHDLALVRAVPADAQSLDLRVLLDGTGDLFVRRVSVRPLLPADFPAAPVRVALRPEERLQTPSPLHFAVNAVYSLPGLYFGTLHPNEPDSRRAELIAALHAAGIGALRFPGGMACHEYLLEGPEITAKLRTLLKVNTAWPQDHVPRWEDVREILQAADTKLIYQLNTCFYVDERGEVQATCHSELARRAGLEPPADGIHQAAAALDRLFERGVLRPGDVHYWELGNEEFALQSAADYAELAAGFVAVLHRRDPDRPIAVTDHGEVMARLAELGLDKYVRSLTTHYPFSRWPTPQPPTATADYAGFSRADVGYIGLNERWRRAKLQRHLPEDLRRAVSETAIYRYFNYDSFRMTASFAHALAFAGNWPRLLDQPEVDLAVYHDLESTYFGLLMYHVKLDQLGRRFDWLNPNASDGGTAFGDKRDAIPFPKQYVPTPTSHVMALLRRFDSTAVVWSGAEPSDRLTGLLAARAWDRSLLFCANPWPEPCRVEVTWPASWPQPAKAVWRMIEADSPYPVLETEYRQREVAGPLPAAGKVELLLAPWSVQVVEWMDRGT